MPMTHMCQVVDDTTLEWYFLPWNIVWRFYYWRLVSGVKLANIQQLLYSIA